MKAFKEKQEPAVDIDKIDIEELKKRYLKYSEMIVGLNRAIDKMKAVGGTKA